MANEAPEAQIICFVVAERADLGCVAQVRQISQSTPAITAAEQRTQTKERLDAARRLQLSENKFINYQQALHCGAYSCLCIRSALL